LLIYLTINGLRKYARPSDSKLIGIFQNLKILRIVYVWLEKALSSSGPNYHSLQAKSCKILHRGLSNHSNHRYWNFFTSEACSAQFNPADYCAKDDEEASAHPKAPSRARQQREKNSISLG
jgi:hypothetical protein